MKSNWVYYALILLTVEKIVQHVVVTLAFFFNLANIASTVVVPPVLLMTGGAIVAILFAAGLWGLFKKRKWSVNLLIGLAVFDIVGEFVAQWKLAIGITVSFLMAAVLLILSLMVRRQIQNA